MSAISPVIVALSPEDIAQIKSSVTIKTLGDVVHGLVCNALDAQATKIQVSVNLLKGSCIVEDNGVGISVNEFQKAGGLAMPYHTSKYHDADVHGGDGLFLSSVAALAFLTITSLHTLEQTANTLTCHLSKPLSKHIPALPQNQLTHTSSGTRVTVWNLFGSIPVRVKQRSTLDNESEHSKEWRKLVKGMVGLILAWNSFVSLTLRDETTNKSLRLGGRDSSCARTPITGRRSTNSERYSYSLNVLTQGSFIQSGSWNSWVPIAGSTSTISIEGAISLDPAPTKQVQFISFSIKPVSNYSGYNELYREVNSIFSSSSFGFLNDALVLDETERLRRSKDGRYKLDAYTHKQIKRRRRGVDRWPMFFLRVDLKSDSQRTGQHKTKVDDVSNLQSILTILRAMVTQWLLENHFQPQKLHSRLNTMQSRKTFPISEQCESEVLIEATRGLSSSSTVKPSFDGSSGHHLASLADCFGTRRRRKRKQPIEAILNLDRSFNVISRERKPQPSAFRHCSRIKSGNPDFYDQSFMNYGTIFELSHLPNTGKTPAASDSELVEIDKVSDKPDITPGTVILRSASVSDNLQSASQAASSLARPEQHDCTNSLGQASEDCNDNSTDIYLPWKHPITKENYHLNTRSGLLVSNNSPLLDPVNDSTTTREGRKHVLDPNDKLLRLEGNTTVAQGVASPSDWIRGLLDGWSNPVFSQSETAITRYTTDLPFPEAQKSRCCSYMHDRSMSTMHVASNLHCRLSSFNLQSAQIISQLDYKFILVKMAACANIATNGEARQSSSKSMLVIIDQHAADERCRIERLLEELCTPQPKSEPVLRSNLGQIPQVLSVMLLKPIMFQTSTPEIDLLRTHAGFFARWGILYDLFDRVTINATDTESANYRNDKNNRVRITALPPGIIERCTAEPHHIIDILRSEIHSRASFHTPAVTVTSDTISDPPTNPSETPNTERTWHTTLSTCPRGILGLLNSRACRSAIMFNDELSKSECEDLVSRLARCVFPWQCAHGRPSVVPLVELTGLGFGGSGSDELGSEGQEEMDDGDVMEGFGPAGFAGVDGSMGDDGGSGGDSFVGAFKKWKREN